MSNKLEEKDLMKTICDLSRKLGCTEGLLERKTEMLEKCSRDIRGLRDDKNRVYELIESKVNEIENEIVDDTGLLEEELLAIKAYNDGMIDGLKYALEILESQY